jgi:hypothetical protein
VKASVLVSCAAAFAVTSTLTACKVKFTAGPEMNASDPSSWTIDGKTVAVDRTFYLAEGAALAFAVEWTCADCPSTHELTSAEGFALAKPVLREAVLRGEVGRVRFDKVGTGPLGVNKLTSLMHYTVAGELKVYRLTGANLAALWDWSWQIDGRTYHVVNAGYYFDQDSKKLFFTTLLDDPALCANFDQLTEESATKVTMPVMRKVLAISLHERLPRLGFLPEFETAPVEFIGVGIACPTPTCAGQPNCPLKIFRTSRSLEQIRSAS